MSRLNYALIAITLVTSALMLSVLGFIVFSGMRSVGDSFQHNWNHLLPEALLNSFLVLLGNWLVTIPLGVSLAWLVTRFEFAGRFWFERLFLVPIAIPPYVLAFILLDVFDFTGDINSQLVKLGVAIEVDAHSLVFVILSMSLVSFPYVYLLTRSSFQRLQASLLERAKMLGLSEWSLFWRIVVPISIPALLAAAALVGMESLADFGAVSMFNLNTLTTLIYKTWFGLFDVQGAMQLASILVALVLLTCCVYALFQPKRQRINAHLNQPYQISRLRLTGKAHTMAVIGCWLVLSVSFLLPMAALVFMLLQHADLSLSLVAVIEPLSNSTRLGMLGALMIVLVSLCLTWLSYQTNHGLLMLSTLYQKILRALLAISSLGYALPGTVLAVCFYALFLSLSKLVPSAAMNPALWLNQSILGLLLIYMVRFLALSNTTLSSAIFRLSPSIFESSQLFSVSRFKWLAQVYWRYIRLPSLSAMVFVFVEIIKEMPGTLMLRPFGWDTLAIQIFGLTQEAEWSQAALPSLLLVLLSLSAVFLMLPREAGDVQ